jgi:cell division GTPase FtsZ
MARAAAFGMPGRIQDPNSRPRSIVLVGLGQGGGAIARRFAQAHNEDGRIQVHVPASPAEEDLQRALASADMIFLAATHGDDVALAPVASRIAQARNRPVTALYIVPPEAGAGAVEDNTLRTLRSGVQMLVVVTDESYVAAMIAALAG